MKVTVLVDNIPAEGLQAEWGLSFYIEYEGKKVLLDSGASGLFAENADVLGIDLGGVEYAVLSHAHDDHAGGMSVFFERNSRADFYLQAAAGEDCCSLHKRIFFKYDGIPRGTLRKYAKRIIRAEGKFPLTDGVWLLSHTTTGLEKIGKRERMYRFKGLSLRPDNFDHEQSLIFETEKGLVVFNSCSHGGAAAIVREVRQAFPGVPVRALIGGFHLYNKPEAEIRTLAGQLLDTGVEYIVTGHCTGGRAFEVLHGEMGERAVRFHTGFTMEF